LQKQFIMKKLLLVAAVFALIAGTSCHRKNPCPAFGKVETSKTVRG
jgi:hypothetical protein